MLPGAEKEPQTMARIENTTEGEKHLYLGKNDETKGTQRRMFVIPRGQLGDKRNQNGVCEEDVPEALIAAERAADKGVEALFKSGDLVIARETVAVVDDGAGEKDDGKGGGKGGKK